MKRIDTQVKERYKKEPTGSLRTWQGSSVLQSMVVPLSPDSHQAANPTAQVICTQHSVSIHSLQLVEGLALTLPNALQIRSVIYDRMLAQILHYDMIFSSS